MDFAGTTIYHNVYGKGAIRNIEGNHINIEFPSDIKMFIFPGGFIQGFLSTHDQRLNDYIVSIKDHQVEISKGKKDKLNLSKSTVDIPINKVIFCNIAWMKYYQGTTEDDIPVNGGEFVDKNHDANESLNFLPIILSEDGESERTVLLGSYETKATNGVTVNQTHIEKIAGCQSLAKALCAKGILVVWCATSPRGENRVVGWYKNATVYRHYEAIPIDYEDGSTFDRVYNVTCNIEDAVLLPEAERRKSIWRVPRKNGKNDVRFGFFRANVWYASESEATDYVKNLVSNINDYTGENAME